MSVKNSNYSATTTTEEDVVRVLEMLERWASHCDGHMQERRGAKRHTYVGLVIICVPLHPARSSSNPPAEAVFEVWTRNLSSSGLSFIAPSELIPSSISDSTPLLTVDRVLQRGLSIKVGLPTQTTKRTWLEAKILRVRSVHEGLIECGIHFVGRTDPPSGAASDADSVET